LLPCGNHVDYAKSSRSRGAGRRPPELDVLRLSGRFLFRVVRFLAKPGCRDR
jgi:hypothetical protein